MKEEPTSEDDKLEQAHISMWRTFNITRKELLAAIESLRAHEVDSPRVMKYLQSRASDFHIDTETLREAEARLAESN
jgi:hypothetical protein